MRHTRRAGAALLAIGLFSTGGIAAAQQSAAKHENAAAQAGAASQSEQQAAQVGQQANQEIMGQMRQIAQDPQTAPDKLFLLNSAVGSMAEVAYSQQAVQKAESEQIKKLAQHMIEDHEKLNQRLKQVAQQLGLQVPEALPRMKQEEIEILSSLPARDFEQHYVANMKSAHVHDIACFKAARNLSKNAQVKQFASESLPTLEQHLQMVDQVAEALNILPKEDGAVPAAATLSGSGGGTNQGGTPDGSSAIPKKQ